MGLARRQFLVWRSSCAERNTQPRNKTNQLPTRGNRLRAIQKASIVQARLQLWHLQSLRRDLPESASGVAVLMAGQAQITAGALDLSLAALEVMKSAASPKFDTAYHNLISSGSPGPTGNRHVGSVGVFILCVNFWRYFRLMGSPILILWGHGQSKSLFLQPCHFHVMRKPTKNVGERLK